MALTSKRAMLITAVVCATPVVSHSIGRSVYGLLLPAIRNDLGLTNSQAGWPSSATFVMYVLGVLGVVFLSPRSEPFTIMRIALVLAAFGVVIAATASGLAMLILGVSLVGGAGAGIWMTAPVLATEYVSPNRRGLVIGALTSTIGLANITLGVGTSWWRRSSGDEQLWRPVWWVAFGFVMVILVAMIGFGRFEPTEKLSTTGIDLGIIRQIPRWREVTIAYALFGGTTAGFGTFIIAALEDHGGVSESTSPLVFSMMGIAGMLAAPAAGALSDRIGRLQVFQLALGLLVAANILVAVGGTTPSIVGALGYGAGAAAIPALIATYVRDSLDNRSFSQALAMMTILFSLMAALVPAVIGRVADVSFRGSYALLALLPLVALFVLATATSSVSNEADTQSV